MKKIMTLLLVFVVLLTACTKPAEDTTAEETQDTINTAEEDTADTTEEAIETSEEQTEAPVETPIEVITPPTPTPVKTPEPIVVAPVETTPEQQPVIQKDGVIKAGTFHFADKEVSGRVELSVLNGKKILKLLEFSVQNENAKPIHIVLSGYHDARRSEQLESVNYVDLGEYVAGQDMYDIPNNENISNFLTVAVYLPGPPQIVYGTAQLTKVE